MCAHNGGHRPGLQHCGTRVETQAGNATGTRSPTGRRVRLPTSRAVGTFDVCRQTEAAAFALPGRCSGLTMVISTRRPAAETSAPYHLDMPLSFVLWCPCICYVGHSRGEANKRSVDSKREAIGGNYPTHNRPIFGQSLLSILGS